MGSYSVAQYGFGGVEVANMSPAFSSAMQKPMYIMQDPAKGQVVVQAVPAANQTFGPQAQPMATLYNPSVRAVLSAQPQQVTLVSQAAPGANGVRLVQAPRNSSQPQEYQQLVIAPQQSQVQTQVQSQTQGDIVYVSVNGVLKQGLMQNGSVYLLNDCAAANPARNGLVQSQQVQPVVTQQTMAVDQRQAAMPAGQFVQLSNGQVIQQPQQQYMTQQQVALPAATRLVPMSQAPVRAAVLPPQQLAMQQQPRPMMTMTVPGGMSVTNTQQQQPVMVMMQHSANGVVMQSSTPMPMMMVSAPKPAGMQAAISGPQQIQMPVQQMGVRAPTAMSATAPRPTTLVTKPMQAVTFNSAATVGQQVQSGAAATNIGITGNMPTISNGATVGQQASMQAFRPALAAGAKIMVSGTSVSASTASLVNKVLPAPKSAAGGAVAAMSAALHTPQVQLLMPNSNSTAGMPTQPMTVPAASGQQQNVSLSGAPSAGGELSSPPAPPLTPAGPAHNSSPVAAPHVLATLNNRNHAPASAPYTTNGAVMQLGGGQSPLLGVIGGQRKSKDGLGMSRSATPTAAVLAGASPTSSAPGSQPGTPARNNSGGGLAMESSSASSLPGSESAGAGNKEAVIRLMARSFIETGIALEQALTMIQASDRDLLMSAFAAEAAGAAPPAVGTAKAADEAATLQLAAAAITSTSMTCTTSNGLIGLGGTEITMPFKGPVTGEGYSLGLSGMTGCSLADDVSTTNDSNSNMGSWGFSLFSGSAITDLSGGIAHVHSLSSAQAVLPDVAAAPNMQNSTAAGAGNKDSAMAGMLASLHL